MLLSRLKSSAKFRILNFRRSTRHIVNFFIEPKVTFKNKIVLFYFNNYEDVKSGGILSILFLMSETEKLLPNATVLPVTLGVPWYEKITMVENPYRIKNLLHYRNQIREESEVLIHVPEIFFEMFCNEVLKYNLKQSKNFLVNILNQNEEVMPTAEIVERYQYLFKGITMTLAFEASCKNSYSYLVSPPHLLKAWFYNDAVVSVPFKDREDLAIISNDPHPYKESILAKLQEAKINYVVIENMPFSDFKKLQQKAKWSISFGEGYDGYSAFAFYKGGVGFGVFNKNFFPANMLPLPKSFYRSYEEMNKRIVDDINSLNNEIDFEQYVQEVFPKVKFNNSPEIVISNLESYYKKNNFL